MDPAQFAAILGGIAAVLASIGGLIGAIHGYRAEVNGRLTALLDLTREASRAQGRLDPPQPPPLPAPPSSHA